MCLRVFSWVKGLKLKPHVCRSAWLQLLVLTLLVLSSLPAIARQPNPIVLCPLSDAAHQDMGGFHVRASSARCAPSARRAKKKNRSNPTTQHTINSKPKQVYKKRVQPPLPRLRNPPTPVPRLQTVAPIISKIRLIGLKHIRAALVRRWIFLQEGESFSRKTLLGDLKRLRKTGYFSSVQARLRKKDDLLVLEFILKERGGRIAAVYFYGNTLYTSRQLLSQIYLRPSTLFNRNLLAKDARRLIHIYHTIGYFRARVTVQGKWKNDSLTLWFVIDEGKPISIRRVTFRGNRIYPGSLLRKRLFSQPPSIAARLQGRGFFHPSFVANDLYLLRNFYYDRGHLQSRITGPKIEVSRNRKWATLVYSIFEGPVYTFGRIHIEGDLLYPLPKLLKKLSFRTGDTFNRTQLHKNKLMLLKMYQNAGYYYTRIQIVPKITSTRKVHLQIYLIKGPPIRIERIELQGQQKTKAFVIRKRIQLRKGDLFSADKLLRSRIALLSTGFFERTDPRQGIKVIIRRGSADNKLVLRFILKEKLALLYNIGFNYLPLEGGVFAGQFGQRNFLGLGQTVLAGGTLSTTGRLWRIFAYLIDPHLFNTDLYFSASGYISHHNTSSSVNAGFLRDTLGGNVSFSHPLGVPQLRLTLTYRIARVRLSQAGKLDLQIPIANYYSTRTTSSLRLMLRWDSRNRGVNATKGLVVFGSYEHAAPYFGGDYSLHRFELGARLFVPLPFWKLVLKFAATTGWSLSPDADGVLPFERFPHDGSFFLLRGYIPYSIGPTRTVPSRAEPAFQKSSINWGGTKKFVFNTELELPLFRIPQMPVSAVVFFDAGNAFDDYEWLFQDTRNPHLPFGLFLNIGFGVRVTLPNVGVMRLEWGIPLTPRRGDPSIWFNFQVGEAF